MLGRLQYICSNIRIHIYYHNEEGHYSMNIIQAYKRRLGGVGVKRICGLLVVSSKMRIAFAPILVDKQGYAISSYLYINSRSHVDLGIKFPIFNIPPAFSGIIFSEAYTERGLNLYSYTTKLLIIKHNNRMILP